MPHAVVYQLLLFKSPEGAPEVSDFGGLDGEGLNLVGCQGRHVPNGVDIPSSHQLDQSVGTVGVRGL